MSRKVCMVCHSDLCNGARGGRCEDLDTSVFGAEEVIVKKQKPRKYRKPPRPDMAFDESENYS